ncbi:SAL1 phosphatase, partial [Trifolium medium]|nr:SAL1 phosphatase [Trifolium medium]
KLGVKAPPVRIDSQAKYGALSRGDGAIYLRFPHKGYREKIWDHAAGAIVVTGAFLPFMSFWVMAAKVNGALWKLRRWRVLGSRGGRWWKWWTVSGSGCGKDGAG